MLIIDRIKALKLILLFALINSSVYIAFVPQGFSLLKITIVLMLLMSVFLLTVFVVKKEDQTFYIHPYFKFLLFLLFLWSFFTIFKSLSFSSVDILTLFGNYLMGWAWITPLAIVFGLNIFNWMEIFSFLGQLLLIGIILAIVLIPLSGSQYTGGIVEWVQFFPILFLTYFYQKTFYQKIVLGAIIVFTVLSIYNEQRVNALYLVLVIFFISIEYLRQSNIDKFKKVFFSIFLSLFILFLTIEVPTVYDKVMSDRTASMDTRTFLFVEMFSDMSLYEQTVGRGALGTYYSPYFAMLQRAKVKGGDSSTRSVNEIGYLEMVLKGGYIMVALYLLILVPAAYLGIFKSNNTIARMSGYLILLYLIIWGISYYPVFSAEYLLLWMAVGTAISPHARAVIDNDLYEYQE